MSTSFASSKGPLTVHVWEADAAGNKVGKELVIGTDVNVSLVINSGASETISGNTITPGGADVSDFTVNASLISNPAIVGTEEVVLTDTITQLVVEVTQP